MLNFVPAGSALPAFLAWLATSPFLTFLLAALATLPTLQFALARRFLALASDLPFRLGTMHCATGFAAGFAAGWATGAAGLLAGAGAGVVSVVVSPPGASAPPVLSPPPSAGVVSLVIVASMPECVAPAAIVTRLAFVQSFAAS